MMAVRASSLARSMPDLSAGVLRAAGGLSTEARQPSGVGNHARDLCVVAVGDKHDFAELALDLGRFGRKDVARLGLAPLDFAGASFLEALGRARMGLQLGHCLLFALPAAEGSPRAGFALEGRDFPAPFPKQKLRRETNSSSIQQVRFLGYWAVGGGAIQRARMSASAKVVSK